MAPDAGRTFDLATRLRRFLNPQEMAGFFRAHRWSLLISLFVTTLAISVFSAIHFTREMPSFLAFLDTVEARSLDARFQIRGPVKPSPEIVIVAIDQNTYDRLGWPFARSHYARMLDTLRRDGAKVVGFDVNFSKPDRMAGGAASLAELEGSYRAAHGTGTHEAFLERLRALRAEGDSDALFARAIAESGNVVLGHMFFTDRREIESMDAEQIAAYNALLAFDTYPVTKKLEPRGGGPSNFPFVLEGPASVAVQPNLSALAEGARHYGAFNFEADSDAIFRRATLLFKYLDPLDDSGDAEAFYPSLDIQIARVYLDATLEETQLWFNQDGPEYLQIGNRRIHTDRLGRVLINYAGPARTFPHFSFVDVADGTTPPNTFAGKIAIVGATAIGIGDMRPSPFQKQSYPGVEIHANVLDNALNGNFLKRAFAEEITDLAMLLLCGVVMGFVFVSTKPLHSSIFYLSAVAALSTFVYFEFAENGRWLSLVLPFATLSLNYLGVISYRVLFEEKEKRRVRGAFSQYVAPGYIQQILKDPGRLKLGGEEAELTVMFSDIRDFTAMSEKLTPTQLVELLNQYLTEMTEVVFQTRGTLDKYIGDAVMAFWGRPFIDLHDHAACACRAALHMSAKLKELNAEWTAQGRPAMRIGIGVNSGPMMVGNMGSQRRFNYTVMGDHVNLGSRVEALNKEYGTEMIITENTLEQVKGQFAVRRLDLIRVKGKQQPVAIYELLGDIADAARHADLVTQYEAALGAYQAGQWLEAGAAFERLAARYPDDRPTKVFLDRCRQFAQRAPEGEWEGVYTMTHK
jgi:adenylate cyclase